jgi:hypothetical protein
MNAKKLDEKHRSVVWMRPAKWTDEEVDEAILQAALEGKDQDVPGNQYRTYGRFHVEDRA